MQKYLLLGTSASTYQERCKMKQMKMFLAVICVLALCVFMSACDTQPIAAGKETQADASEDVLQAAADWLMNTVGKPGYGSVGGEWITMALARSNVDIPDSWFEDYFQALCTHTAEVGGVLDARKHSDYSRVILAVTAIGKDPRDVGGFDMVLPLADFDQTVFQGTNGAIYALLALDCGNYEIPENETMNTQATRELYVDYILNAQLAEGGWAFSGTDPEADMTAMALQALAKYRDRQDVAEAVDKSLEILSQLQNDQGGYFTDDAGTSETISQVIVALGELGINLEEERFVKNGNTLRDALMRFRTEDGGFSHLLEEEADLLATEQAFYALVSAERVEREESPLFFMQDTVEE